ncbi:MAG: methyltransferase domain-containing protein [Candidatus Riflebacteria bacterium]|nr:methyltransferase domain-containing protein [Candidatus Riflebacteria bacterium]
MDLNTLNYYEQNASLLVERYQGADVAHLQQILRRRLNSGMTILEIGCGSGRDARFMQSLGCCVTATDASAEMITRAQEATSCDTPGPEFINAGFPLPEKHELLTRRFDAVVAVAVLMHVPDQELFHFACQIRTLLSDKGIFVCSFCTGRPADSSDARLFVNREPAEVQLLFERIGFRLLAKDQNSDGLNRDFIWNTLVLAFDGDLGVRPIDQIESIINRDNKRTTYKLALLRGLCEIAQTAYQHVQWHSDDRVSLPLGLVTEKWLYYYWPIFEASFSLPELHYGIRAKSLAFRSSLEQLIGLFKNVGGFDAFHAAYQNGKLSEQQATLLTQVLNEISLTIIKGPIVYSGGAMRNGGKVFEHQHWRNPKRFVAPIDLLSTFGRIYFPASLWREMILIGHWIEQAIILRWAELSYEFAKKTIAISDILACLIICPETERSVSEIKAIYTGLPNLSCVWSNQTLSHKRFDVDHVIPFSLWHNNDLWNLLPASPKVNNRKRDKMVSRATLCSSEERVVYYWQSAMKAYPQRFQSEMNRTLLGGRFKRDAWEKQALASLYEVVELVALQRGVERWQFGQSPIDIDMESVNLSDEAETVEPPSFTHLASLKSDKASLPKIPARIFRYSEVASQAFEQFLPLVADVAAGPFFDGFQTGNLDHNDDLEWIEVPSGMCRPRRFVVRVAGGSMEPLFQIGELLVFEYHRSPGKDGEIVLAASFSAGSDTGEYAIKRFRAQSENWLFESDNPEYKPISIPKYEMAFPILGIFIGKVSGESGQHG